MTPRSLQDWLAFLEQLHPVTIDMGLERSRAVATRLGVTRPAAQVVTVTGTNGKGSTCAFIAQLLAEQGRSVGVYSSPHLVRYNERVRLNGVEASDAALCQAFEAVEHARGDISLTYFEFGTLAALWLFQRERLDIAVLEVGLGGRLDAVNLVDADVAVVTNIGLDHAEYLGTTRESVAFEKAGIFRPGRPAVCGDREPPGTLRQHAQAIGAQLWVAGADFDHKPLGADWHWQGRDRAGHMLELADLPIPRLPLENAALALQAYALLDAPWTPDRLAAALEKARMVGRLDRRVCRWKGREVPVVLDVGHNPHAAAFLARQLGSEPRRGRRLAVFGLLADKDLAGVLDALLPSFDHWAVAPLPTPRSRSATEIGAALKERGARVSIHEGIARALECQLAEATDGDEIVLFGSFYCVAQALAWLERNAA